jgi:hypothetical protein
MDATFPNFGDSPGPGAAGGGVGSPVVRVLHLPDGGLVCEVNLTPDELPPVLRKDLDRALDQARAAALLQKAGPAYAFRFRASDGATTEVAIADPDARCWAAAVAATTGLGSAYAVALCLRVLGVVDLAVSAGATARARITRRGRGVCSIDRALLDAAAFGPITADGRIDPATITVGIGAASTV